MLKITAPGLVIREQSIGESDKLITVLTAKHGIVRAFSRGAKKAKSKKGAATSLLAYSDFTFSKAKDTFSVEEALVKEVFFELREDVSKMALAQYFCELAYEFCEDDFESEFSVSTKPMETLFSLSEYDNVIYLNTFSKTISPAIRVAYIVLPKKLVKVFHEKLGFYSCTVPTFEQFMLTDLLNSGEFERYINRVRRNKRKDNGEKYNG